MEPPRERIEDLMHRYGYQEEEAKIAYHLIEARNRLIEMYQGQAELEGSVFGGLPRTWTQMFLMSNVYPHFEALHGLLERRVLARDYPEGWGRPAREEEGEEER